ncbi:MAG: DUF5906 domain-containing protein [Pseudomonadota bacterium]|jgi:hypothetical protein|nr:DUF5906 domain-containing protein [Pseudomonadota bacterium]
MAAEMLTEEEAHAALERETQTLDETPVTARDFWAYLPGHSYIFTPTRELWPGSSVNASCRGVFNDDGSPVMKTVPRKKKGGAVEFEDVPVSATEWLDQQRAVEQMTWAPGMPMIIEGRLISGGGWIERPGCRTFNLYQPPPTLSGDPSEAGPWLAHLQRVFPEEAAHITKWLAYRIQHPGEKINHALVFGGDEEIGKDTILEPIRYTVGPWNVSEVSPQQILGRFNSYVKSVILRVSEARDLGEIDRYALHEHLKTLIAAPPDVLRCDEKNLREYSVLNVCGVIITTNHVDGIYLQSDSRRYFVAWSELVKENFPPHYWQDLYHWYHSEGGIGHVAAYLGSFDLSDFDPKAPPPKTAAFWRVVNAGRAPEDAELADALELLKTARDPNSKPPAPLPALTISMVASYASESFRAWLTDRKNSRQIPHRMKSAGYVAVPNDAAQDGLWKVDGKRQVIYSQRELPLLQQRGAATALVESGRQ